MSAPKPLHEHMSRDGFRLRGTAMSRIEGFSDVVFGFALTLIVVSLEVPHTFDDLRVVLFGFIPFFICFAFLITVWWAHYHFFRRYGLHDTATIIINSALLFCLLFYVYPLKFLFSLVIVPGNTHAQTFSEIHQLRELMTVYGFGFSAIYLCIVLLYANAYRQRHELRLNKLETALTLACIADDIGSVAIGLLCVLLAQLLPPELAGKAGWAFFVICIYKTVHGIIARKRTRLARARCSEHELTGPITHG